MPRWKPGLAEGAVDNFWKAIMVPFKIQPMLPRAKSKPGAQKFSTIDDVIGTGKRFFLNNYGKRLWDTTNYERSGMAKMSENGWVNVQFYDPEDHLSETGDFSGFHDGMQTEEGLHKYYNAKNHALQETVNYKAGRKNGEDIRYYPLGLPRDKYVYRNDTIISKEFFNENGAPVPEESIHVSHPECEVAPAFPGGEQEMHKFLSSKLIYPADALQNGTQGIVAITFVINTKGKVENIRVRKDIGSGCGLEAARVVSTMPDWIPGNNCGNPVRVTFTVPLKFKLDVHSK